MHLRKICAEIADMANDDTLRSGGDNYSRCKGWVRQAYYLDILSQLSDWYFLRKTYSLQTPAENTTGTASTTNGSSTVTGSGTSWTSTFDDRMLVIDAYAQRISSVGSTTSLTLESSWENETVSGKTIQIVKDLYELPRWIDPKRILEIKQMGQGPLTGVTQHDIFNKYTVLNSVDQPKYWWPHDRVRNTYTTGTVEGTAGTKILTGSSTSWLSSDIQQYDQIKVGNEAYTVDTVDGNSQITLFENIESTISTSTTYTAVMDRYRIRVYPFPKEQKELMVIASNEPTPLDDDSDIPSIPDQWQRLLVRGGYVRALKHNQEPGYQQEFAEYQNDIKRFRSWNNRDDYRTDTWWKM